MHIQINKAFITAKKTEKRKTMYESEREGRRRRISMVFSDLICCSKYVFRVWTANTSVIVRWDGFVQWNFFFIEFSCIYKACDRAILIEPFSLYF